MTDQKLVRRRGAEPPALVDRSIAHATAKGISSGKIKLGCVGCMSDLEKDRVMDRFDKRISTLLGGNNYGNNQIDCILIMLHEAIPNIMEHALGLDSKQIIEINFNITEERFRFEITHGGQPFSLNKFAEKTLGIELQGRNPLEELASAYDKLDVLEQLTKFRGRGFVILQRYLEQMGGNLEYEGNTLLLEGKKVSGFRLLGQEGAREKRAVS